ncbi:hypothetical protein JOL62DRAFT_97607 [Phyllosticta paracitricarpa]|uniref:Uncharacterized protein n=1 Tax=Phyllosticta paracitricarpa TaxID=2016321 RepID=A0ABR1N985_9PEZI
MHPSVLVEWPRICRRSGEILSPQSATMPPAPLDSSPGLTSVFSPVSQTRSDFEFAQIDLCVPGCAQRLQPHQTFSSLCRPSPSSPRSCVGRCQPLKFCQRPTTQQNINNRRASTPQSRPYISTARHALKILPEPQCHLTHSTKRRGHGRHLFLETQASPFRHNVQTRRRVAAVQGRRLSGRWHKSTVSGRQTPAGHGSADGEQKTQAFERPHTAGRLCKFRLPS